MGIVIGLDLIDVSFSVILIIDYCIVFDFFGLMDEKVYFYKGVYGYKTFYYIKKVYLIVDGMIRYFVLFKFFIGTFFIREFLFGKEVKVFF